MAGRPKLTEGRRRVSAQDEPIAAMAARAMNRAEELSEALRRRKQFFIGLYTWSFKDNEDVVELARREEQWLVEMENSLMALHATVQRIEYNAGRGGLCIVGEGE